MEGGAEYLIDYVQCHRIKIVNSEVSARRLLLFRWQEEYLVNVISLRQLDVNKNGLNPSIVEGKLKIWWYLFWRNHHQNKTIKLQKYKTKGSLTWSALINVGLWPFSRPLITNMHIDTCKKKIKFSVNFAWKFILWNPQRVLCTFESYPSQQNSIDGQICTIGNEIAVSCP